MPNTKVLKHKIKNFHKNIIDSDLSICSWDNYVRADGIELKQFNHTPK